MESNGWSPSELLIPVRASCLLFRAAGVQAGWRLDSTTMFPEMVMGTTGVRRINHDPCPRARTALFLLDLEALG